MLFAVIEIETNIYTPHAHDAHTHTHAHTQAHKNSTSLKPFVALWRDSQQQQGQQA